MRLIDEGNETQFIESHVLASGQKTNENFGFRPYSVALLVHESPPSGPNAEPLFRRFA